MSLLKSKYLPLLLTGLFVLGLIVYTAFFFPFSGARTVTDKVSQKEIMTGRDDPVNIATEFLPGERIDINSADSASLQRLPGIGETMAERIIQYRIENGPFESLEELMKVSGIGEKTFENIRNNICLGESYENTGS